MNMQHSDLFFLTAICLCIFDAHRMSSLLPEPPHANNRSNPKTTLQVSYMRHILYQEYLSSNTKYLSLPVLLTSWRFL